MLLKKKKSMDNINLVPMIDVTSFILMAMAILTMTMKKEASLDSILTLPPVLYASKQDSTQLQIYILPARVLKGGNIDPDSTGLIAFDGKGTIPNACPRCATAFRSTDKGNYVPNTLLSESKKPIATMGSNPKAEADKPVSGRPVAYYCASCGKEISPYLKLDEIPLALKAKKKELTDNIVLAENFSRANRQEPPLTEAQKKGIEESIPLMIKADNKAFYGRILEVVYMAKDTVCNIRKFSFVTLAEASLEAQKKDEKKDKKK